MKEIGSLIVIQGRRAVTAEPQALLCGTALQRVDDPRS